MSTLHVGFPGDSSRLPHYCEHMMLENYRIQDKWIEYLDVPLDDYGLEH